MIITKVCNNHFNTKKFHVHQPTKKINYIKISKYFCLKKTSLSYTIRHSRCNYDNNKSMQKYIIIVNTKKIHGHQPSAKINCMKIL